MDERQSARTLTLMDERQSARMSKITNDSLTCMMRYSRTHMPKVDVKGLKH